MRAKAAKLVGKLWPGAEKSPSAEESDLKAPESEAPSAETAPAKPEGTGEMPGSAGNTGGAK